MNWISVQNNGILGKCIVFYPLELCSGKNELKNVYGEYGVELELINPFERVGLWYRLPFINFISDIGRMLYD